MARTRPYLFYDVAISICSTCYRRIDAKIVFEDDRVFMLKHCPEHGHERVLIADDVDYYRRCRAVGAGARRARRWRRAARRAARAGAGSGSSR